MEVRDHFKNGASPKSLTSRGNFLRKVCFALLYVLVVALMLTAITACGGSGSSGSGKAAKIKMTTEQGGDISFRLGGSGVATVDWGDGSEKVSLTLNENENIILGISIGGYGVEFKHTYPSATIRNISINGDNITVLDCKNCRLTSLVVTALTELDCSSNQLTSLDVSKSTALIELNCRGNQLTSLDVSKNTALIELDCSSNQLTSLDLSKNVELKNRFDERRYNIKAALNCNDNKFTAASLNFLFGTLHDNNISDIIVDGRIISKGKFIGIYRNPGTNDCNRNIAENKGWEVLGD